MKTVVGEHYHLNYYCMPDNEVFHNWNLEAWTKEKTNRPRQKLLKDMWIIVSTS